MFDRTLKKNSRDNEVPHATQSVNASEADLGLLQHPRWSTLSQSTLSQSAPSLMLQQS